MQSSSLFFSFHYGFAACILVPVRRGMHIILETARPILETARPALRRFTEDDVDNRFRLSSDPPVMRYLAGGRPTPLDEIRERFDVGWRRPVRFSLPRGGRNAGRRARTRGATRSKLLRSDVCVPHRSGGACILMAR